MLADDIDLVAEAISKKYSKVKIRSHYGWEVPALNTLDCVLSLNRRYDSFVVPRITAFKDNNSNVKTLEDLKILQGNYRSTKDFIIAHLNYNDIDRARILSEVIDYLLFEQTEYRGKTQYERLRNWAHSVRPGDAYFTGIKGFGLSGFQYLRMLFGVQTTKPDVHIKNFVSVLIGRKVNDVTSLVILERAAKKSNLPLREVDGAIWKERARMK